jgi:Fur family ferric uptake transcriptional regulator
MNAASPQTIQEINKIFLAYLEKKELRKTPERLAILEEIYSRTDHFDADELWKSMDDKNYRVSKATVYNTLDLLVECNLIVKHQFGKNLAQYEKSYGSKQHDHLICMQCHEVTEFCDPRIQTIQTKIGDILGFNILHHSLIFYGDCTKENCEKKQKNK